MKQFFLTLILAFLCNFAFGDNLQGGKKPRSEVYAEAERHGLTFVNSKDEIPEMVSKSLLVPLVSETNFEVDKQVSYPYVLPEVRIFAQQISEYLNEICGERMVITSALRPTSLKLINSVDDTVHPTGMALDIRRPPKKCREWFEARIKYLEYKGAIQATREHQPPHYHVVVYPDQYATYVAYSISKDLALYEVRGGDTLSTIAKRFGTTITELVILNSIDSPNVLRLGQKVRLR